MASSLFFRGVFLLLWAAFAIIRIYYGRKTKTHDSIDSVKEKLKTAENDMSFGFKILTAVFTVIGVIGLILYLWSPSWWTWTRFPFGELFQWTGFFISIPPMFYLVWVHRHLDTQWSIALELKEDHKLITSGPYKSIRHPMYLGIFIYTLGIALVASDILVFIFFMFSIWVNYRRIPVEEQMMIDEFGEEYLEYMKRSGKLFPPFGRK